MWNYQVPDPSTICRNIIPGWYNVMGGSWWTSEYTKIRVVGMTEFPTLRCNRRSKKYILEVDNVMIPDGTMVVKGDFDDMGQGQFHPGWIVDCSACKYCAI